MKHEALANANDLNNWSNTVAAGSVLPKIIRRLINGTIENVQFMEFRSDDGVAIGGWDGRLETEEDNTYVPGGKSVWEMGTNKAVKAKADEDYEKRTAEPGEIDPSDTTYIFVTSRRWGGKNGWIESRSAEKVWKEVRAYDADDLETWLEQAPHVHVWLSTLLGKRPDFAVELSTFWDEWRSVTNPPISANLVLAGRHETSKALQEWLSNGAATISLQGASRHEAIAVFASAIQVLPDIERDRFFARAIVVESLDAWRTFVGSGTPLVLIPDFDSRESVAGASVKGHHVLIPLGKNEVPGPGTLTVRRLRRQNARGALVEMGVTEENAAQLATLARRSLLSLRRRMAVNPEIQQPHWAEAPGGRDLLPVLLTGEWVDSHDSLDQEIVANLGRTTPEALEALLSQLAHSADSPVLKTGQIWYLASREDSWNLLARYLTREDLETFEKTVIGVFGAVDPRTGMSLAEQFVASIEGKKTKHTSGQLREGLAETVALMAAMSDSTPWLDASTGQQRADRIVWRILDAANKNSQLWSSFANQLPLFAEAAPEQFLTAVEQSLDQADQPVMEMFIESGDGIFGGGSMHHHLLWAFELLSWNPEYISRTALSLAKMARLDPGGRTVNRPIESLRAIFLGWFPQTNADVGSRLRVIDNLRNRENEVAWKLILKILPRAHDIGHNSHTPKWRTWSTESERIVTNGEIWDLHVALVSKLIEDVGLSGNRWNDLLNASTQVSIEQHDAIVSHLEELGPNSFVVADRMMIWETLRKIISHHRSYPTAQWALPAEPINKLETIYKKFSPPDIVDQHSWMFDNSVELINPPDGSPERWKERAESLHAERCRVLEEIYSAGGLPKIAEVIDKAPQSIQLGNIVGSTDLLDEHIDEIFDRYLLNDHSQLQMFGLGYAAATLSRKGWDWATKLLTTHSDWSVEQKANFFSCLSFDTKTWDFLESLNEQQIEDSYWSRINPGFGRELDFERVTRKLIEYKRPQIAVDFLALFAHGEDVSVPPELAFEVLEKLIEITANSETPIQWGNIGYDLTTLMKVARSSLDIETSRLAGLEWYFMPFLENYGEGPKLLHQELSTNSAFFVDVVKTAFRRENDEPINENSVRRSQLAYNLLNSWRTCPGTDPEGLLQQGLLNEWITSARLMLVEADRVDIGDEHIGQALAAFSIGTDGVYPHEFVREVLENLTSHTIERGFEVRVFNNRGVTMRNPTDGGEQERTLAQRYFDDAEKIRDIFPRTAVMLKRIGESYRSQARGEDINAEITEDFWR